MHELTAEEFRARLAERPAPPFEPRPMAAVDDLTTPSGALARVYRPTDAAVAEPASTPTMVYFHGGGFVIGSVANSDLTARKLADGIGCTLVSIEYRLAPEHPFPAAVHDVDEAIAWVAGGGLGHPVHQLFVGGDSAGANLAFVGALHARDAGIPLVHQLLVYPCVDPAVASPSHEENGDGYLLTRAGMAWFWRQYLGEDLADADHPDANPLLARLHDLPPATVTTAGFDPLRDEGLEVAATLARAGTKVTLLHEPTLFHGFIGYGELVPAAARALGDMCATVRAALARGV